MSKQRGFTLIEILVAVAIFGLLSVAAYTVLDSGLRSREQSESRLEGLAELQRAFYSLGSDINYLTVRKARNELGDFEAIISGQSDLSGQEFELRLVRNNWRNPAGFRRSQVQYVSYRLEDSKLIRQHRVFVDAAPNSPVQDRLLAENIKSLRVQFQDAQQQWHDQWGQFQDQLDALPVIIKISLESETYGVIERLFLIDAQTGEQQVQGQ